MPNQQTTLFNNETIRHAKALTENQRRIVSLVACELTQAQIAKRLGFSRSYINQVIKKLESYNLIKRINTQGRQQDVRNYNYFYEVLPECRIQSFSFTPYRVHLIRKKFSIIRQSAAISTDRRTSFSKSWPMRGWQQYKFWFPGKAGMPSVTIDANPKSLIAYIDRGQNIAAESMEQAKEIAWYALYSARDAFIAEQLKFGIAFEIERVGEQIVRPHAGLVMNENGPFKKAYPVIPGLWIDKSVEKELGLGMYELEGHTDHPILTGAEECLIAARDLKTTLPEAMKDINAKLDPMNANLIRVESMLQGGITLSQQYDSMVNFMTKALDEMATLREEMRKLKSQQ